MALVTGSWLLDAALLLLPLLYWYMTRNFDHWKKLGIPYMKPKPFVGNMGGVVLGRQHMGDPIEECYHKAGDAPFMGLFAFDQPLLMVKDPELVGRVLSWDFSTFHRHNGTIDADVDPFQAMSLFGVEGIEWKRLRAALSPVFTSGKIKLMFQLINEVGDKLVHHLDGAASKGAPVDLKDTLARYSTDVACSIFLGVEAGALENPESPMRQHMRSFFKEDFLGRLATAIASFSPKLNKFIRISISSKKAEDFFRQNTKSLIEHRKDHGIVRNDLVGLLMPLMEDQANETGNPAPKQKASEEALKLTNDGVASNLMSFIAAGFETSSSTLSFSLFELARHPEIQEQVRQHILEVLEKHGGQATYDAIGEMKELNNVVDETLRLYPPVLFHDRKATRDYQVPGTSTVLPEGTAVVISVPGLHRDPRYWDEPLKFMPDRFKEENSKDRPNYTFLPFSEGPRMCLGMRLAYVQTKLALVHILKNFEVKPLPETPTFAKIDPIKFIGTPAGSLSLSFTRVHSS